jgi:hypothetical protein
MTSLIACTGLSWPSRASKREVSQQDMRHSYVLTKFNLSSRNNVIRDRSGQQGKDEPRDSTRRLRQVERHATVAFKQSHVRYSPKGISIWSPRETHQSAGW